MALTPLAQLREVAARALSSLTAPGRCVSVAHGLLSSCSRRDQNGAHGKLLAAERLVSLSPAGNSAELEALSVALQAAEASWLHDNRCAATQAGFLALCAAVSRAQDGRASSAAALVDQNARTLLQREHAAQDLTRGDHAATPALLAQCAQLQVPRAPAATVAQLLAHPVAEVRFAVLDSLYTAGAEAPGPETTSALLACLLNPEEAEWVATAAARALARGPELVALQDKGLQDICDRMLDVISSTPSMPLQAALLPVYAAAVASLVGSDSSEAARHLDVCCAQVAAWSEAEQVSQAPAEEGLSCSHPSAALAPPLRRAASAACSARQAVPQGRPGRIGPALFATLRCPSCLHHAPDRRRRGAARKRGRARGCDHRRERGGTFGSRQAAAQHRCRPRDGNACQRVQPGQH